VSMPPLDASELDVPCEFDALQTDERIKPVMVRPGQPFDLGGGRHVGRGGPQGWIPIRRAAPRLVVERVVVELASRRLAAARPGRAPHGGESSISVSWYEAQNAAYVNQVGSGCGSTPPAAVVPPARSTSSGRCAPPIA
jgi:hypothetical protein